MQHAPSVSYPVGRSVFHGAVLLSLSGLLACVVMYFSFGSSSRMHQTLLWWGWCGVSAWAGWSYWRAASGWLQWQGGQWQFNGQDGSVILVQDGSFVVLLRWIPKTDSRQPQWLWIEQKQMPGEWLKLRRALYSGHMSSLQQPS